MSKFEDFIRSQGFSGDFQRGCNGQYKSDLLHFMEKAFMHQQAKIDELQNIIDELKNHIEINFDEDREDDQHSYWSGYNQALREIKDIG